MAATKKLGPRASVLVAEIGKGKGKPKKAVYSYMLKSTAEFFGLKIEQNAVTKSSTKKKVEPRSVRGSVGAGSIKIPVKGDGKTATKYKRIPMPAGISITNIKVFLKKISKNKPESFVTRDGRTYPLFTSKK